jgi:hypothetical protein
VSLVGFIDISTHLEIRERVKGGGRVALVFACVCVWKNSTLIAQETISQMISTKVGSGERGWMRVV